MDVGHHSQLGPKGETCEMTQMLFEANGNKFDATTVPAISLLVKFWRGKRGHPIQLSLFLGYFIE